MIRHRLHGRELVDVWPLFHLTVDVGLAGVVFAAACRRAAWRSCTTYFVLVDVTVPLGDARHRCSR